MDLLRATQRFRALRKIADGTAMVLMDCSEALRAARSEYERTTAEAAYRAAEIADDRARAEAKEARRAMSNLKAGLTANGGRTS